jgi:glucosyl-3-phosphoglycerate synthase
MAHSINQAGGGALDPAIGAWARQRRYRAEDFSADLLASQKGGSTVTVVIPTKECAATIGAVIRKAVSPLAEQGLVDELVVIDADSADGTAAVAAQAGARVIQQDDVLSEFGPALGKGDALWRSVHETGSEIVCFIDGDTIDPVPSHPLGLIAPLLADRSLQLVKGAYDRPLRTGEIELPGEGGRVTELMARPLLNLYEPQLAGFAQPLAGEFAARRALLERIPFPVGYGIEIAVLIDALRLHGLDALGECHIGTRRQTHQPLRALGEMSYAVLAAVERRAGERRAGERRAGDGDGDGAITGLYVRPWDELSVASVPIDERPPLASLGGGDSEPSGRR